jgi:thymidylate synthase
MSEGFPLLTTKQMAWKSIVTELLWFLRGDTNIRYLVDNGCHIWDGDAYKNYQNRDGKCYCGHTTDCDCGDIPKEEFIERIQTDDAFSEKWGDLGPIYGKQWRKWETDDLDAPRYEHWKNYIDQIANLVSELKTNPDSRRMMVSAWNVGELNQMVLPPCHYAFQCYTRELGWEERSKLLDITNGPWDSIAAIGSEMDRQNLPKRAISLMWNQRSVDTFLGLPFNIASYGLLLEIIAKEVNMIPDELIGNLGDTHLYLNHLEQATEQIGREPYPLPTLSITGDGGFMGYSPTDFRLIGYESHPAIKAPLSN